MTMKTLSGIGLPPPSASVQPIPDAVFMVMSRPKSKVYYCIILLCPSMKGQRAYLVFGLAINLSKVLYACLAMQLWIADISKACVKFLSKRNEQQTAFENDFMKIHVPPPLGQGAILCECHGGDHGAWSIRPTGCHRRRLQEIWRLDARRWRLGRQRTHI